MKRYNLILGIVFVVSLAAAFSYLMSRFFWTDSETMFTRLWLEEHR